MSYSVKDRADYVGTFRWVSVQAMEMLARWIPTTPEMEVKVLFGRHVWDFAQQADALGKRAFELRVPLHYQLPACGEYQAWLSEIASLEATADRVSAFYDVLVPAVASRYRRFIEGTDPLMDEPTVRILERALVDFERVWKERRNLPEAMRHVTRSSRHDAWSAHESAIDDVRPRNESATAA